MAKPIFCLTHPRACSTAFERVFMTRLEDLVCAHEPFGDAFYYGPERLSIRYESDEKERLSTGFADSTFKTIFDRLENDGADGKRVFVKDMAYYLCPPDDKPVQLAPSLDPKRRGVGTESSEAQINGTKRTAPYPYPTQPEEGNPTVVPNEILEKFHFTFLIRDPHSSVPSYWRCCIPPLDEVTGFYEYYPNEAGYDELKRVFDFLRRTGHVGPSIAGQNASDKDENGRSNGTVNGDTNKDVNGSSPRAEICLLDADDLLDDPDSIVKQFCKSVGMTYKPSMLTWDTEELQTRAKEAFEKWKGFHNDAINSKDLKPRAHKKATKTEEQWDAEWKEKYGEDAAKIIRETVDRNMPTYLYLKQFAIKL